MPKIEKNSLKKFADYKTTASRYITIVDSDFYPDYLEEAKLIYKKPLTDFRKLLFVSVVLPNC